MATRKYQIFRGARKNYDFFLAGSKVASKYCTGKQAQKVSTYLEAKHGFKGNVIHSPNLND